jgi:polyferredoxin
MHQNYPFKVTLAIIFTHNHIGLTLSWVVGWPLLIFSFFFLVRTWCSICGLSVSGWLAQLALKPERPTPQFIRQYSGWIMTLLCILLFWIEIAYNAYESPRITGWIISSITMSSLFFSMFFKRRVWCRYLCPLGAINALFVTLLQPFCSVYPPLLISISCELITKCTFLFLVKPDNPI